MRKMKNINEFIFELMNANITANSVNGKTIYWYNKLWSFEKVEGKSLVESFFIAHPKLANEYYDVIFDQIHPY